MVAIVDNYYLKPYGDVELQRRMVSDRPRTDAFAAAIREVVKPGDVVLDVGTGTGILAMLAAKAGAREVHAIDATDIAAVPDCLHGHRGRVHIPDQGVRILDDRFSAY